MTGRRVIAAALVLLLSVAVIWQWKGQRSLQPARKWVLPIVPHPKEVRLKGGDVRLSLGNQAEIILHGQGTVLANAAGMLQRGLASLDVISVRLSRENQPEDSSNTIVLTTIDQLAPDFIAEVGVAISPGYPGREGYLLVVDSSRVLVAGRDEFGVGYGVQSLLQLLRAGRKGGEHVSVPAVTVIDYRDMPLRSAFYGFYLNAMEDDSLIARAELDFDRLASLKFNMIDLASHHYGHLDMTVPGHPDEKLWQRFARLHAAASARNLTPRVGGWAKWVNTHSNWGADLTTLEGIRTQQRMSLSAAHPETLRISVGTPAPNVMYDFARGKSWSEEPVWVTDESADTTYTEGVDFAVNYGAVEGRDYREFVRTSQSNLEVLFSSVIAGEGEPAGYPLRRGTTFNDPTTIQRLPGGRIREGQEVQVSFSYIGPDPWSVLKVRYCRSDQRLHTDGPENYIWRWCTQPVDYFGAADFALDVDETRVFAWDQRCLRSGKSRSRIWADDIAYYFHTIREARPDARIFVWSDMLDPAHNARTYGTTAAADMMRSEGMGDAIMIPWKSSLAQESVNFFADRDFPLMPSCQDVTEDGISTAPMWAAFLRARYDGKGVPFGMMHCRWGYAFDKPGTWAQAATVAEHAWSVAPYIVHTPVPRARAGQEIVLEARVEGDRVAFDGHDVVPGPLPLKGASVYYRTTATKSFQKLPLAGRHGIFKAILPAMPGGSLEYYISVSNSMHTTCSPDLSISSPYKITIQSPGDSGKFSIKASKKAVPSVPAATEVRPMSAR